MVPKVKEQAVGEEEGVFIKGECEGPRGVELFWMLTMPANEPPGVMQI